MRPKNIELHIEELVLEGFEQFDRQKIAEVVERELTRLFTESGIPPSLAKGGRLNRLDAGAFQLPQDSRPGDIGSRVARAVYGELRK